MRCPHCGHANPEGARFCNRCGGSLSVRAEGPPAEPEEAGHVPPGEAEETVQLRRPELEAPETEALPPPPVPPGPRVNPLTRGWGPALGWSVLAFVVLALIGQALAFLQDAASGASLSPSTVVKIGGFYFYAFHRTGIVLRAPRAGPEEIDSPFSLFPGPGFSVSLGFAFLLVTALAVYLLYRGGRAVADRAGGGPLARALHGLKVAVPYALLSLALSFAITFRLRIPENPFTAGTLTVRPSHLGALLWPLGIGAVSGLVGGLWSARSELATREPWGRRAVGALAGGWLMFVYALGFAFVGLLGLAAAKPDDTSAYLDAVSEDPLAGASLVVHHVLALPNQSLWVLVPSMGACDGLYGGGFSVDFLCYDTFPQGVEGGIPAEAELEPGVPLDEVPPVPEAGRPAAFDRAPPAYFLFLLVPLVAVVAGGVSAGGRAGVRTPAEGAGVGAMTGVAFGLLVGAGAVLGGIAFRVGAGIGSLQPNASFHLGPHIGLGTGLALLWGVGGGALGGSMRGRGGGRRGTGFDHGFASGRGQPAS